MNTVLTNNWNSIVGNDDVVYCIGDFGFSDPGKYASRLTGKKILILGNHDRQSQCNGHFEEICNYKQIEIDGRLVHLKHYPYKSNVGEHDNKFIDRMLDNDGNWLIHGHVHNSKPKIVNKSINVGVEWWNYTPIPEEEIVKIIRDYREDT